MRLIQLKNETRSRQYQLIIEHEKISLLDAIREPAKVRGRVLCFLGNYAGFSTEGLVIRKFIYNFAEKKWIVSDKDLSDDFEEFFNKHFERNELFVEFGNMLDVEGFLLTLD